MCVCVLVLVCILYILYIVCISVFIQIFRLCVLKMAKYLLNSS